jgi:hypothetical protein
LINEFPPPYEIERDFTGVQIDDPNFADLDTILQNWNIGSLFLSFLGHGTGCYWSGTFPIDSSDLGTLNNQARLPIVIPYGIANEYQISDDGPFTGCIPYSLLSNPNGGSIGYFANSTIGWAIAGLQYKHRVFEAASDVTVGTLGELWRQGNENFVGALQPFPIHSSSAQTVFSSVLFGDPGLRLPDRSTPVSEIRTESVPHTIELLGNYPNPFNSTTTLRYELPSAAHVTLSIYNIEGRQVATLVNEVMTAGEHSILWSADAQASGIYFATLRSGDVTKSVKLVYLR